LSVHDGSIGSLLKGLRTHALDFVIAHQDAAASPKDLIETPLFDSTTRKGMELLFLQMGRRPVSASLECLSVLANATILRNTDAIAIAAVPTAELFVSSGMLARLPLELPLIFGHISLFAQPTKAGKAKDDYFVQCVKEAAEELGTQYR